MLFAHRRARLKWALHVEEVGLNDHFFPLFHRGSSPFSIHISPLSIFSSQFTILYFPRSTKSLLPSISSLMGKIFPFRGVSPGGTNYLHGASLSPLPLQEDLHVKSDWRFGKFLVGFVDSPQTTRIIIGNAHNFCTFPFLYYFKTEPLQYNAVDYRPQRDMDNGTDLNLNKIGIRSLEQKCSWYVVRMFSEATSIAVHEDEGAHKEAETYSRSICHIFFCIISWPTESQRTPQNMQEQQKLSNIKMRGTCPIRCEILR